MRMLSERSNPGQAGFSLVELLAGLAVMSLVGIALSSSLTAGIRSWQRTVSDINEVDGVSAAQNAVRRLLESARPLHARDGTVAFSGSGEELTFIAAIPHHVGFGGDYRFNLRLETDKGLKRLSLRSCAYFSESDSHTSCHPTVLISGISKLTFRFSSQGTERGDATWVATWKNQTKLPGLIEVTAEFPDADRRSWQAVRVSPRLSGALEAAGPT